MVDVVYGLIVSSRKMRKSLFRLGSGIQQTDFFFNYCAPVLLIYIFTRKTIFVNDPVTTFIDI